MFPEDFAKLGIAGLLASEHRSRPRDLRMLRKYRRSDRSSLKQLSKPSSGATGSGRNSASR